MLSYAIAYKMLHRKYVYIFSHCNFEECVEFGSGLSRSIQFYPGPLIRPNLHQPYEYRTMVKVIFKK